MSKDEMETSIIYTVVVNHETQYSLWPDTRELPPGWQSANKKGTREECLQYISEVWTDMRPLSLRQKMDQASSPDTASTT
jgi:MbtH protein